MAEDDQEEDAPESGEDQENEAGAGDGAEGEDGESEGGGFDSKKIILFVVLPLLVLVGAGAGLFFSGTLDKIFGKEDAAHEEVAADDHGEKKKEHGKDDHGEEKHSGDVVFLKIPDITVNLSTSDGQPRFLRLSVQLELASQEDLHTIEQVMPRVIDQFQTYLRELRVRDLRGSAGMYRLQMELMARVNAAAYPVEVRDVLFQEILIQ